ncbi:MAG TPA: DUF72 domain-containing protein [Flavobacteriales bacterium]|nr:DUF72 domain-containing protein [Flavobacteriales bacterium]
MGRIVRIGTAGWQLPKGLQDKVPNKSSQLERYATRFNAVEVNSTFYRLPRLSTVERWAASVPHDFRFALKLPRRITHELQLRNISEPLATFLDVVAAFGPRMGPVLVQLPPKLEFNEDIEDLLMRLCENALGTVVIEPRHSSWFTRDVEALMNRLRIARVAADPPRAADDGIPAGHPAMAYIRLHGTPRIYWSAYEEDALRSWAGVARAAMHRSDEVWMIFDNTAAGAAALNALDMQRLMENE